MGKGAIFVGIALIIISLIISIIIIFSSAPLLILIYPAIGITFGIVLIAFNKEEDKIEQRKDKA